MIITTVIIITMKTSWNIVIRIITTILASINITANMLLLWLLLLLETYIYICQPNFQRLAYSPRVISAN